MILTKNAPNSPADLNRRPHPGGHRRIDLTKSTPQFDDLLCRPGISENLSRMGRQEHHSVRQQSGRSSNDVGGGSGQGCHESDPRGHLVLRHGRFRQSRTPVRIVSHCLSACPGLLRSGIHGEADHPSGGDDPPRRAGGLQLSSLRRRHKLPQSCDARQDDPLVSGKRPRICSEKS